MCGLTRSEWCFLIGFCLACFTGVSGGILFSNWLLS